MGISSATDAASAAVDAVESSKSMSGTTTTGVTGGGVSGGGSDSSTDTGDDDSRGMDSLSVQGSDESSTASSSDTGEVESEASLVESEAGQEIESMLQNTIPIPAYPGNMSEMSDEEIEKLTTDMYKVAMAGFASVIDASLQAATLALEASVAEAGYVTGEAAQDFGYALADAAPKAN